MSSTAAAAAPTVPPSEDREVPLWRLHLLRAIYAVFVFPAIIMILFDAGPLTKMLIHAPTERGMINGIQVGLFAMSAIGLFYPLRMLPILIFEFTWKGLWLFSYGIPQWLGGVRSPQWDMDIVMIGGGPILFGLVIPWSYVFRHYFKAPPERWR